VGLAAERGVTLRNHDLTETDLSWDERVQTKTHSSLVVPLMLRGELAAVLDLRNRLLEPRFTNVDEQLAEGLARQAILFLDNAQFRANEQLFENAVGDLIKTVTEKYLCWPGHVDNVTSIASRLAKKLNLSTEKQEALRLACLVHDIGLLEAAKVDIGPPGGPVDHASDGADRIEKLSLWAEAAPIVRHHHEQMDGRGPLGKRGFAIPMTARILALAEYVDTVTNPGSPWAKLSLQDVVNEISSKDDKRFDPTVVLAFVEEHMDATSALSGDLPTEATAELEEIEEADPATQEDGDPWAVPGS
jgi:putative nucleotidyltransferase with HDIG domain